MVLKGRERNSNMFTKKCLICGTKKSAGPWYKYKKGYICFRHHMQLYKHGKFINVKKDNRGRKKSEVKGKFCFECGGKAVGFNRKRKLYYCQVHWSKAYDLEKGRIEKAKKVIGYLVNTGLNYSKTLLHYNLSPRTLSRYANLYNKEMGTCIPQSDPGEFKCYASNVSVNSFTKKIHSYYRSHEYDLEKTMKYFRIKRSFAKLVVGAFENYFIPQGEVI